MATLLLCFRMRHSLLVKGWSMGFGCHANRLRNSYLVQPAARTTGGGEGYFAR